MFNPLTEEKNFFLLVLPLQNSFSVYPESFGFYLKISSDGGTTAEVKKCNLIEIGNAYFRMLRIFF